MRAHSLFVWLIAPVLAGGLALSGCRDTERLTAEVTGGVCAAPVQAPALVKTCSEQIPAAESGVCDVTPGTGAGLLIRGDVLGRELIYEDGAVLIEGKEIVCVGCDCAGVPGYAVATRIDCADAVISPALINAHDHLTFNEAAPLEYDLDDRWEHRHQWRGELATPGNPHGSGDSSTGTRWSEMRHVFAGATSIMGAGRADGMLRNIDDLETNDIGRCVDTFDFDSCIQEADTETFPLGDSNRLVQPNCQWDYRVDELEASALGAYVPHISEGIDELANEEFRCQSSPIEDGRDYTERNTSHIHGVGLHTLDYALMARDRAKLIWSARTNITLYGVTAQVTTFASLGGVIALGTDWTYSGSANMLRELACVDDYNRFYLQSYFSDKEMWEMVTLNAAVASGAGSVLGSLEKGKFSDVAVFAKSGREGHRAVIEAENRDVALVLKAGRPLYGEDDVILALDDTCSPLDVCGETRAVCTHSEFGVSLEDIQYDAADEPPYPLFFCGEPPGEPTCVPSRPGEYTGLPTELDSDGDGVLDKADTCPCLFNPIRPLDRDGQPDLDGDGLGDPCDPDPLGADLDDDGTENLIDNCPLIANGDQTDTDQDGRGDACDCCPKVSNPGSVCPRLESISAVQSCGAQEAQAVVQGVVTGVGSREFTIQDPDAADPTYSGVLVFVGSAPSVAVGDRVEVDGEIDNFFGLNEISNASVTVLGRAVPIQPIPLTVKEAAQEKYEGVLVELTDVSALDLAWDCSVDNSNCSDDDIWQVCGAEDEPSTADCIIVYNRFFNGDDSAWQSAIGEKSITGVMYVRFDRRRILPRNVVDFFPLNP